MFSRLYSLKISISLRKKGGEVRGVERRAEIGDGATSVPPPRRVAKKWGEKEEGKRWFDELKHLLEIKKRKSNSQNLQVMVSTWVRGEGEGREGRGKGGRRERRDGVGVVAGKSFFSSKTHGCNESSLFSQNHSR